MPRARKKFGELQCVECKRVNYIYKNKRAGNDIEYKKFCAWCKKNIPHKMVRKAITTVHNNKKN